MAKDKRIWIKLAVGMPDIPKIAALSDAGFRAYVEMLCYSRDQLTDGFIHERIATRLWGDSVDELTSNDVEKPSLIRVEGGFQIHDYAEHQETRADVDRRRAAGAKGGRAKAANRSGTSSTTSSVTTSGATQNGAEMPSTTSTESRVQSPERLSIKTLSSQSSSRRAREFSTDEITNQILVEKARKLGFADDGKVWAFIEVIKEHVDRDLEPAEALNLVESISNRSKSVVRNRVAYTLTAIENNAHEVRQLIDQGIPWEAPRVEAA